MSKIIALNVPNKESFPITSATITTGWMPGQGMKLNTTGDYAEVSSVDTSMFIAMDDDLEVVNPPSASLVTGIYGSGTKFIIDHSAEVAASSATRAYNANLESAATNQLVYIGSDGKWTTAVTGSVKAQVFQVPSALNNYGLGLILRF